MQRPKTRRLVQGQRSRRQRARRITQILRAQYGSPRHSNPEDPLDDLIFIMLSTMTTGPSYERVYERLRDTTRSWDIVAAMDVPTLRLLIQDAGLSAQKAPRIIALLHRIREDFREITLSALKDWDDARVERYLLSLPGVGLKSAKCVMMYALGRTVLPVDTHVMRVARRLGLLDSNIPYSKIHSSLEDIVHPEDRYHFHVNALAHGRAICRARYPRCEECSLRAMCAFFVQTKGCP
jgi:endonuclease III